VASLSPRTVKEDLGVSLLLLIPVLVCAVAISKTIRRTISSIQFGTSCMAFIVLCLIGGTLCGAQNVFRSAWFNSLFVLLLFCILLATIKRRKFDIKAPGFYASHLGVVIILTGVFIKNVAGEEGVIHLWRGKRVNYYVNQDGTAVRLGFDIRLDRFIQAGHKSKLTIIETTKEIKKIVSVNNPFSHNGFIFYQFDYDPFNPDYSGLKVVKDPGMWIIYAGFVVMLAGIIYMVITVGVKNV
jgi:cytochrome c biogenesis protein ResB